MKKRQRFYFILFVLACLAGAVGLSLYALRDNLSYFYSPREVVAFQQKQDPRIGAGQGFRLGGLVLADSVQKNSDDLQVLFTVTDNVEQIDVVYTGILPDLFREGQGVVATGSLLPNGMFKADSLLAKHDENYMPPEVAKALKDSHAEGVKAMQETPDAP